MAAAKPTRSAAAGADASTADDVVDVGKTPAVIGDEPTPAVSASTAATPPSAPQVPPDELQPPAAAWPARITVRNHSALAVCEPLSGIYLAPGQAHDNVVLRNPDHAVAVLGNLREIVRINQLGSQIELIGVPANF